MKLIWLTRPFSPTTISLATVRSMICTNPVLVASFNVMVGSYFAWIGQIGMQFVLPAHGRRFHFQELGFIRAQRFQRVRNGEIDQRARDLRHRIPVVSRELDTEILLLFHIRRDPE